MHKDDIALEMRPMDRPQSLESVLRTAILEERRRFSRELHDVVASGLHAATLYLAEVRQSLPPGDAHLGQLVDSAEAQIRVCWDNARRCAAALRPVGLETNDLIGALADYVAQLSDGTSANITFGTTGTPCVLPDAAELALLRVGQEAVTNALRHASPTAISIELSFRANAVYLEVSDDGHGFDPSVTATGSGLRGMRERAAAIGGELELTSQPQHGTQLVLNLPHDQNARVEMPKPAVSATADASGDAEDSTLGFTAINAHPSEFFVG